VGLIAAAQETAQSPNWWPWVAAVLGSSVLGGLLTATLGNVRAAAEARRDGYARAVRALITRVEYPYRIRRRVSDDGQTLTALAERGHDIQEQLAACRTWVNAEHRTLGLIYDDVLERLDTAVAPAARDAWAQQPIVTGPEMALGGWGPGDQWPQLKRLQHAISFRFGWRRVLPGWFVRWRTHQVAPQENSVASATARREGSPTPASGHPDRATTSE
jgi:hypothetical protein